MTLSSARPVRWLFVLKWIVANAIGFAIGQAAGALLAVMAGGLLVQVAGAEAASLAAYLVAQLTVGASLGASQRIAIRREFDLSARWIGFSALGWALGYVIASLSAEATGPTLGGEASSVLSWALLGAVFGLVQHVALRRETPRAVWWIAFNALAWAVGPLLAVLGSLALLSVGVAMTDSGLALATAALNGAITGALTGLPLLWLLRDAMQKDEMALPASPR